MNIAQQLQILMNSNKISRSALARQIGVHTSTVSNWLDGKDVKTENLDALCAYFNCSMDYLVGKTNQTKKAPTGKGERPVSEDDIKFALFNGDVDEITDEMYEDVKRFAQFIKEKKNGKNSK